MSHPVVNEVGAIFVPVRDIEKARDWYCDLLGLPAEGDLPFGHLYVLPMKGSDVVLDSKIYKDEHVYKTSPFHFNPPNIQEAYTYVKEKGISFVTDIEHDHYFTIEDPDGNHIMICQC